VQPADLGLVRHELAQHPGQLRGPLDQVGPHQGWSRRGGVPGGEEQVDDVQDLAVGRRNTGRQR
jgi:hypothetical protein